jgi:alanyl-tRNA synthetase
LQDASRNARNAQAGDLLERVFQAGGINVLATKVDVSDGKALREMADEIRGRLGSGIVCLGADTGGKAALLVAVTSDLTSRFKAGDLVRTLAPIIDGRGGGKPDLAQAGGGNPQALDTVFGRLKELVEAAA